MGQLDRISSPDDVRRLTSRQADDLAAEIRTFLVEQVSRTGGHLGPNLGVVELTIAMHRVFESPLDTMVFDTGHQAYVHKLLTGRRDFSQLRSKGGLSGYPSRAESEHDVVENSHASTALSLGRRHRQGQRAAGPGRPARRRGDRRRRADRWDGLGGAQQHRRRAGPPAGDRGQRQRPLLRADHRRPGAPPGHPAHDPGYENVLSWGKRTLRRSGRPAVRRTRRCTA